MNRTWPLVRDALLSFCPAGMRNIFKPGSTVDVNRAAFIIGIFQAVAVGIFQVARYKSFVVLRLQQFAPVVRGSSEAVQTAGLLVVTLEFLIQPWSLLLNYFFLEGLVRMLSAGVFEEPLCSLPMFLGFRFTTFVRRKRAERQVAPAIPDSLEILDEERLRIASCSPKPGWNATVTVGVRGTWYEVEKTQQALPPRRFVYTLRRCPIGRVLRAYQEYDAESALALSSASAPLKDEAAK